MDAYIEQQGVIPEDAQSLRLMAEGEFTLTLNSRVIPMVRETDGYFAGDISKFAGEMVTMRITSRATDIQQPVLVDGLAFSVQAIPEASPSKLLICGLLVMFAHKKLGLRRTRKEHA